MGLFDWFRGKKEWELEAEPELRPERQLPAATPEPAPTPRASVTAAAPQAGSAKPGTTAAPDAATSPAKAAASPAKATPNPEPEPAEDDMPDFGIQKAIELMRDLPSKDSEVVVQAVCKTLASIGVEVPDIISQAKDKQGKITGRIGDLKKEIAELEEEIAARKEEIRALEADFAETGDVRARLEKATSAPPASGPQASGPAPKPGSGPISSERSGSFSAAAFGAKPPAKTLDTGSQPSVSVKPAATKTSNGKSSAAGEL